MNVLYVPTDGFFDLTEKPKEMTSRTHKKIQQMQMMLIAEAKKYEDLALRRDNQRTFDELRGHAARLQGIILRCWPGVLFVGEP